MNTKVTLAGIELKNPVMTCSGTFGSGMEFGESIDLNKLGAVAMKYNFPHIDYGVDIETMMKHKDTLLRFADLLNSGFY